MGSDQGVIHAIDEVCGLEIEVECLSELLSSGIHTVSIHGS